MENVLKKCSRAVCCLAAATALVFAAPSAEAKEKVLLDADMVEMFDDGVAMMILERSAETELLGVTVVTGNTWAEDGASSKPSTKRKFCGSFTTYSRRCKKEWSVKSAE